MIEQQVSTAIDCAIVLSRRSVRGNCGPRGVVCIGLRLGQVGVVDGELILEFTWGHRTVQQRSDSTVDHLVELGNSKDRWPKLAGVHAQQRSISARAAVDKTAPRVVEIPWIDLPTTGVFDVVVQVVVLNSRIEVPHDC